MRVGVVVTSIDSFHITGIERYAIEFIRNIPVELTDEVVLFGHKEGADIIKHANPSLCLKVSPFNSRVLTDQVWLPLALRKSGVEFVYNTSLSYPALGYGLPFAQIIYDATPWKFPETTSLGMKYYYLPGLNRLVKSAQLRGVITISVDAAEEIVKSCMIDISKIFTVYLGIDHSVCYPRESRSLDSITDVGRYILAVGTLEPRKNIGCLLQAFQIISHLYRDLNLIIVGRVGWERDLSIDESIADKVKFTGYVTDDQLMELYSNAEVFVFPSMYEGFGLPLVEAMACGAPVVASNASSLPEIGGDACLYADPNAPADFADKVVKILTDQDLRQAFVEKGRTRSSMYRWDITAIRTWEILNELQKEV